MTDAGSQAEEFYASALAHSNASRFEEALGALRRAEALRPDEPRTLHLAGSILLVLGRWAEAAGYFRRVIALRPDFRPAYLHASTAAFRLGDVEEAAARLREALALHYEDADVHYNLGTFLQSLQRLEQAAFHFREALRLRPGYAAASYNLGVICLARGRSEEALAAFTEARAAAPRDPNILRNLAHALRRLQRYAEAVEVYRELSALQPLESVHHYDTGASLLAAGRPADAAAALTQAVRLAPGDANAYSTLAQALFLAGRVEAAREAGQRALELKDAESLSQVQSGAAPMILPNGYGKKRRVIAFSLWGDRPTYTLGAIENAKLARAIYPEWTCRFYLDTSVPQSVVQTLAGLGAELHYRTRHTPQEGLFWRFLVADDTEVGYFLVRDCDSRLNRRERIAVEEWLASGRPFHVMRDHPIHTELILAGMWGGVAGTLPAIESIAAPYYSHSHGRWSDQLFLKERVWPLIKEHCLIHDAYYKLFGARSFPTGDDAPPEERVAASHILTPRSS